MDHTDHPRLGLRQSNLKKSFNLVIHSLLTACSKEEFHKAFSAFNYAERDVLHRLFIQVITSLHRNLEEEFECICQEAQVGPTLDKIEQLVEEQSLDILFSDKTNLGDVKEEVLRVKKDEINYLMSMLDTAVEQNHLVKARIESLEKEMQESSATGDAIEKFGSWNSNYGQIL